MTDEIVKVTMENCEAVAQKVVDCLVGTVFGMASFCQVSDMKNAPKSLNRLVLSGGYRIVDGSVRIKLHPRRQIFWDVRDEQVTVTFSEGDDSIIIERKFADGRILYRVIMVLC